MYICLNLHSSINSRVCSNTEVCPWYIVTYSSRNHTHDNAELIITSPCLHQLENSLICLWGLETEIIYACTCTHTQMNGGNIYTSNPPITKSDWMLYLPIFSTIFSMQEFGRVLKLRPLKSNVNWSLPTYHFIFIKRKTINSKGGKKVTF